MSFELEIQGLVLVAQVWDGLAQPAPAGPAGTHAEGSVAPLMTALAVVPAGA